MTRLHQEDWPLLALIERVQEFSVEQLGELERGLGGLTKDPNPPSRHFFYPVTSKSD